MTKPDPVQHMMTWGAMSSGAILLLYFLLVGSLTLPNPDMGIMLLLGIGIFGGLSLGGMSGVIIGSVFQHEQADVNVLKIQDRRSVVLLVVFIMVFFVTRILLILAFGIVGHPLVLSLIGAMMAAFASQHYLYRMQAWLKHEKPKRKNDQIPQRLLDSSPGENNTDYGVRSQQKTRNKNH
ncbi:MAG: hypothetical protein AAF846_28415 [Chloroflexota bacterium]